jgi:demethylmenaquinone methyltransferase / 2-methoxy-6-polyprenyl-1,4-benzoquinol methylase
VADVIDTTVEPLPAGDEKARVVEEMFDRIAPRYDLLNRMLTFRMDVGWRRTAVAALGLEPGARVMDLACGTGDLCRTLRAAGHEPIGVDFSVGMLASAHTDAPLVRADASRLPFPDASIDAVTCGFALRNFVELSTVLAECARVLRPHGGIALLDVGEPTSAPARTVHNLWFRHVVPFVGGLLSDRRAYSYLPASTAYLPPQLELLAMIGAAGFENLAYRKLGAGAAQRISGVRV